MIVVFFRIYNFGLQFFSWNNYLTTNVDQVSLFEAQLAMVLGLKGKKEKSQLQMIKTNKNSSKIGYLLKILYTKWTDKKILGFKLNFNMASVLYFKNVKFLFTWKL